MIEPFDQAWAVLKGQYPRNDPRIQGFLKPQYVEVENPYTQRLAEDDRPIIDYEISINPELADYARSLDHEDYGFSDLDKTRYLAEMMGLYSPTKTVKRYPSETLESADFTNRIQPEIQSRAMEENDARRIEFERRFAPSNIGSNWSDDRSAEIEREKEKEASRIEREDDAMRALSYELDFRQQSPENDYYGYEKPTSFDTTTLPTPLRPPVKHWWED